MNLIEAYGKKITAAEYVKERYLPAVERPHAQKRIWEQLLRNMD